MRIIGIDPGSIICGYGLIETANSQKSIVNSQKSALDSRLSTLDSCNCVYIASGRIALSPESPLHLRLKELHDTLIDIIREYNPKEMVVERIFFAKGVKTALDLGQVRGIALLCATSEGLDIYEYSALEVKKAITGYGRAEKKQVREMVMRILNLNSYQLSAISLTEDSADALALALCHINTVKFNKASSTP
ncbi:MAG: crossover junction endodeoxyribonuclease RuvC [Nitrospirota bacterium]